MEGKVSIIDEAHGKPAAPTARVELPLPSAQHAGGSSCSPAFGTWALPLSGQPCEDVGSSPRIVTQMCCFSLQVYISVMFDAAKAKENLGNAASNL